jgi:hypothetical protein
MTTLNMTPKDFAPHLLAVIGEMTDASPGVVVAMERTYDPVCVRMGVNPDAFGIAAGKNIPAVHRKIQLAMRQLRDNGLTSYPVRGQWTLTEQGRTALVEGINDEALNEPVASVAMKIELGVAAEETEETEDNVVSLVMPRHPYSDDLYIRGLAIERTTCFSAFSSRSDVCRECPLQRDCIAAAGVAKAEIAAEILREEAEARRVEDQRQAKKARQDASIDELIASQEGDEKDDVSKKAQKSTTKSDAKGRFKPRGDQQVADAQAQRESECAQCRGTVPEGAPCFWVEDEGVFHPECIEVPLP